MSPDTERELFKIPSAQISENTDAVKILKETQAEHGEEISKLQSDLEAAALGSEALQAGEEPENRRPTSD